MSEQHFSDELITLIKQSVAERGLERSLHDTIANQYVIEQIQTEYHCIISALIKILIDSKIIKEEELNSLIEENIKQQEEALKKTLQDTEDLKTKDE